jgi:hypothetical protein
VFQHDELDSDADILVLIDGNGVLRDTAPIPRSNYQRQGLSTRIGNSVIGTLLPFAPDHMWSVTPAGHIVTAVGDRYAIDVQYPGGAVLRIIRQVERVPVSAEERAVEEARVSALFRRRAPDWRWEGPSIPLTKPAISWLHTGTDGTIWVRVAQPGTPLPDSLRTRGARSHVREPMAFDVYDSSGVLLGQVIAPDALLLLPFPVLSLDVVWGVVRDADGVQYVARFRRIVGMKRRLGLHDNVVA